MIHRRPVECFDADGRPIGGWPSTLEAAMKTGYSKTVIKTCAQCQQRTECQFCKYFRKYRRIWRYTDEV